MRRLLAATTVGGAILAFAACGGPPPANQTVIAEANRSIMATFASGRTATRSAVAEALRPVATAPVVISATPRSPTATPGPAAARERLIAAESALDTGEFDSAIGYDNNAQRFETIRFDLGHGSRIPRAQSTITYRSAVATRSIEVVAIGAEAWQRSPPGSWSATDRADDARAQVLALLPRADLTAAIIVERRGDSAVLRWYDAARGSDMEVETDAATGIPRRMQRIARADGTVLTVSYRSWNTPVAIERPAGM